MSDYKFDVKSAASRTANQAAQQSECKTAGGHSQHVDRNHEEINWYRDASRKQRHGCSLEVLNHEHQNQRCENDDEPDVYVSHQSLQVVSTHPCAKAVVRIPTPIAEPGHSVVDEHKCILRLASPNESKR